MLENDNTNGMMDGNGIQNIDPNQPSTSNFNGNGMLHQHQQQQQQQPHQPQPQQPNPQQQQQSSAKKIRRNAQVVITEQPAWKALRFRYECEGRSAGSIPGINSTPENKTFPTIEIVGYKGRAVVVVSCVTKDQPYRPHPHNLVGKEGCKKGVCTLEINSETMRAVFSNLGIQCVKKKDIEAALVAREDIRVDPFKTGFAHKNQPSSIDLNAVRLCFQVFLESDVKGRFTVPLQPVVSDPIFDKKAMSDLVICRLCSCSSTVEGNKEIILLCEKVAKEDISVRFFEEQNGQLVWEAFGDFQHTDVHKQTAITFKTPRYKTLQTTEIVKVFIQLRRPSDGAVSEPLQFDYLPLESDPAEIKRKRQKTGGDPMHHLKRAQESQLHAQNPIEQLDGRAQQMHFLNVMPNPAIKTEPRDTSPLPYMFNNAYRMPDQTPSPQPVSPPYNHNTSNTPSPYHMGGGMNGNVNMLSPNHHYHYGPAAPGAGLVNGSPIDYDIYHHQQQQQQHPQLQQQQQHQHPGSMNQYNQLYSPSAQQNQVQAAQQWQGVPVSHFKQPMPNNINNLINFNLNNPLTKTAVPSAAPTAANNNGQNWNVPTSMPISTNNFNIDQMLANTQHHQQQPVLQNHNNLLTGTAVGVGVVGGVVAAVADATSAVSTNNNNNEAPSISSLLNIDSEQLMDLNSAELSSLSISEQ